MPSPGYSRPHPGKPLVEAAPAAGRGDAAVPTLQGAPIVAAGCARESAEPARVTFVYWGRKGLSWLALDVARAAVNIKHVRAAVCVSRQNDRFADFAELGDVLVPVTTFSNNVGACLQAWRIGLLRRQMTAHVRAHQSRAVIELMPHVWSPFVMPAIQALGVRHVTIVHDATPHPGDLRSTAASWLLARAIRRADLVLTLSRHVAADLRRHALVRDDRVHTVFLPNHQIESNGQRRSRQPDEPLRLLFLGRILPYKGLPLFVGMLEELKRRGLAVAGGVFGEGPLGPSAARLAALDTEIVNRWLTDAEIEQALTRFDAVVLSHTEASQSGVAALALGAGLPVIATPVGGLREQIQDGETGVLAERADPVALADAAIRIIRDPALYSRLCQNIAAQGQERSIHRFVAQCLRHALSG